MHGIRNFVGWILALGLIAMFLMAADTKLFSDPEQPNVVFSILAENTGYSILEPTGRYVVGILEAFVALMLLFPWTRRFGAFMGLCIAGGALAAHLSPYLGQEVPLGPGLQETDGASLFYLSIAMTAASGLLLFTHPDKRPTRRY